MAIHKRILVTGPDGFVGAQLCGILLKRDHSVVGAQWKEVPLASGVRSVVVGDISETTNWKYALKEIDTVIHLAARVHIMHDQASDPLAEFRKVNVFGTENLARQAARAGVKRFVFISSIKVLGEETTQAYTEESTFAPQDPYAISKMEAELVLQKVASETGMELVILRPPLVYGPGVKANFFNLLKMVGKGIPLPLGCIENKRSLIYVENLADAIAACTVHPQAAGKTFLVSDGEDVSTPELVRKMAHALSRSERLFSVPPGIMNMTAKALGKSAAYERLTGSLQVNISRIKNELGWSPPFSMEEGLKKTAQWYLENEKTF